MIVARSLRDIRFDPETMITIGTFDGVHKGHCSIILELVRRAQLCGCRSFVVTFEPHPREVVGKGPVPLLTTLTERLEIMKHLGVDIVLVLDFTYDFSRQTSREFYENYIVRGIGVREVIVGHDHTFGRDRKSGIEEVRQFGREFGFGVDMIDPVSFEGEQISSTKIRNHLMQGNVELAAEYLNRRYTFDGLVVAGDRRGATLGFPTANLEPADQKKVLPGDGVYCVNVQIDERKLSGMMNIGFRPTFQAEQKRIIEVNLFDFGDNIYGRKVGVQFIRRIRGEKQFSTKTELIEQLHRDRSECMKLNAASQLHLV